MKTLPLSMRAFNVLAAPAIGYLMVLEAFEKVAWKRHCRREGQRELAATRRNVVSEAAWRDTGKRLEFSPVPWALRHEIDDDARCADNAAD